MTMFDGRAQAVDWIYFWKRLAVHRATMPTQTTFKFEHPRSNFNTDAPTGGWDWPNQQQTEETDKLAKLEQQRKERVKQAFGKKHSRWK